MQVTFTHRAPGSVFTPNAFDSSIGKEIDVHLPDRSAKGRLMAAEVAADGSAVSLTVEVPDGAIPLHAREASLMAFPAVKAPRTSVTYSIEPIAS